MIFVISFIIILVVNMITVGFYAKSALSESKHKLIFIFCSLVVAIAATVNLFEFNADNLNLNDFITIILIGVPFIWVPIMLTVMNTVHLFKGVRSHKVDLLTIFIGGFYCLMLTALDLDITNADYNTAIYSNQYHRVLSSEYSAIIVALILLGYVGMLVLSLKKPEKTPPLVSALSTAFCTIMLVLNTALLMQMAVNFKKLHIMFWLYQLNLIIISARIIRFHITEQVRLANERETDFRSNAGKWLHSLMSRISSMTVFSFMLILPIAALCEVLYILLGQGPDGFIKAFTMTADWTFSTQAPPPPLEYQGHYLCTVAAGGHKKIVKPIRYGIRRGEKIIVNRQLLAANAFEDLIHERLPKFHRGVRSFYDKYGYPVSKFITTQTRADIVYLLMKPLEFAFIAVLYMFDTHPENRIAIQYSTYKK